MLKNNLNPDAPKYFTLSESDGLRGHIAVPDFCNLDTQVIRHLHDDDDDIDRM